MSVLGKDFLPKASNVLGDQVSDLIAKDSLDLNLVNKLTSDAVSDLKATSSSATEFLSSGLKDFDLASAGQKLKEGADKLVSTAGDFLNDPVGSIKSALGFDKLSEKVGASAVNSLATPLSDSGNAGEIFSVGDMIMARENNDDVIVTLESTITGEVFRVAASPRISESRHASYSEVSITHHPGSILKYERTASRAWGLSVRLISRTPGEAYINQAYLNLIRGWVMPFYGEGSEKTYPGKLGAPPEVLLFSGYGSKNISPVPVVLESYDTSFPNDVDYIPTFEGEPFPVILEVNLNLKEAYSPREYTKFDLMAYKGGDLPTAFSTPARKKAEPKTIEGSSSSNGGQSFNNVDVSEAKSLIQPSAAEIAGTVGAAEVTPLTLEEKMQNSKMASELHNQAEAVNDEINDLHSEAKELKEQYTSMKDSDPIGAEHFRTEYNAKADLIKEKVQVRSSLRKQAAEVAAKNL